MRNFTFISFGLALLFVFSCKKKPHCQYEVHLPFAYVNKADTVSIGDTMIFESRFSKWIEDRDSGQNVALNDFKFQGGFGLLDIGEETMDHSGLGFDVYIEEGDLVQFTIGGDENSGIWDYNYKYSSYTEEYHMRVAIVPNVVGTFLFALTFGNSYINDRFIYQPKECRSEQISIFFEMNNGDAAENNFHLLQYAKDDVLSDPVFTPEKEFEDFGNFAFVVVE